MNLNAIANAYTRAVNPNITQATLRTNSGYTTSAAGDQIPSYIDSQIEIQSQSIDTADLEHMNIFAQQGQYGYVYANGLLSAQRRTLDLGGDLLVYTPYGEDAPVTWKILKVIESYADWTKVLVCRQ